MINLQVMKIRTLVYYINEPEYSKENAKKRKLDSSSETTDSGDNLDSSRLEIMGQKLQREI